MIIPELRLILECCKGLTSVEDAVLMKNEELTDKDYNPDYDIIVDIQEFETNINSETSKVVRKFTDFLRGIEMKGKRAFLTSEPHQVVVGLIIKEHIGSNEKIRVEVFSTVEAAMGFLGLPKDKLEMIKGNIAQLKSITG